jgi:YVTN family beta-propeller protein
VKNPTRTKTHMRLPAVLLATGTALLCLAVGLTAPVMAQDNAQPGPTPLPIYALPDARLTRSMSTNTIALAEDNRTLAAANTLNNTVSIVLPTQGQLVAEIPVGADPRTVAFFAEDQQVVVANRGDGTLSVIELETQRVTTIPLGGVWPYGVVVDGTTAYVSLQGSDAIAVVDLIAAAVTDYIPVPDAPTGMTLWGDFLYVAHFWSGQVSLVYLPQAAVITTVSTGVDTGLFQAIEMDITRGIGYLPQTRSNAQNASLTFDTTVFPVVNVIDFRDMSINRRARIGLDTVDRPVNMPFAAALDRFRNWLYVANAGSNNISVVDLNTRLLRAHIDVGANPRGILLNRDGSVLFSHNALDGTLSIIETRTLEVTDQLPISDFNIPVDTLVAQQLFYSAADPRLSADSWISCGNCHFDGMSDGRTWMGFAGGRNTPSLYGLLETAPYNWDASWDELADVELKIRSLQAGTGLIPSDAVSPALGDPHSGLSLDLDVLASYLSTLPGPANPITPDPALVERGQEIFDDQNCAECHVGTVGTDSQRHDVGTGGEFDTPSLRWLWVSAPYFHDGSAVTLGKVFMMPGDHNLIQSLPAEDIDALVSYLLTLPQTPQ